MSLNYEELLRRAYECATESHDPSTQNGALLVSDEGAVLVGDINRFPQGVAESDNRWERPLRHKFTEHAERNVCYSAARQGIATNGLTLVCPLAPCSGCARAIIQSGIKRIVIHKQAYNKSPNRWREEIDSALSMLKEAGVEVVMHDGKVGAPDVLCNGEPWMP